MGRVGGIIDGFFPGAVHPQEQVSQSPRESGQLQLLPLPARLQHPARDPSRKPDRLWAGIDAASQQTG